MCMAVAVSLAENIQSESEQFEISFRDKVTLLVSVSNNYNCDDFSASMFKTIKEGEVGRLEYKD